MTAGPDNYTFFTLPSIDRSPEAIANNKGFENHPELGVLYAETPCDNCYELISSRTELSKTFIKEGTGGKSIMQQTSNAAMHYRDINGNWRTIRTQLEAVGNGMYAATAQPTPVTINTAQKYSTLGKAGESFRFNNNLELIYVKPGGTLQSIGAADWTHYTAGDDGVYVTNAWPGIDIEMHTIRGAVKTNFHINHALPEYADGQLLVRDHLGLESDWSLYTGGQTKYTGNLEIRNSAGDKIYAISAATAFEKGNIKGTLQMLQYDINGDDLDIALPGDFLNRAAAAYPVIIDPLVSVATSSTVNGSTYSPAWTVGCVYTNAAVVPPKVTVTDVQFNFQYVTSGGALLDNGAFDFHLSSCRSPTPTGLYWNCNSTLTGTCTGIAASIFPSISSCMPPPSCASYNLNLVMDFYQNYLTDPPCSNLYITASSPLTITVFGNTIETSAITASPSTICEGESTSLTATSTYGVEPYTFVWSPGGATGTTVTESPTASTIYTVTSTDACGDISTATTSITVLPSSPITGITTVCIGGTATLSDAAAGGTWSSSNTAVTSISSTGTITGVSVGTAVITYSSVTGGCTPTATVTVNPPVDAVTGITRDCARSSITLSDGTSGGTWTTGNPAVATVNAATGVVIGVSAGSAVITYTTFGGGCFATATMSIDPLASVTGPSTVCLGGTVTLTDSVSGGEWESTGPSIASIGSASGIVTGESVGTVTIIYNTIAGCSTTTSISVIALTPITGIETLCPGNSTILTDATTGGIWSSGNTAVATAGISTGIVSGVSGGTAVVSYSTPGGCAATVVVTVSAAAPITGIPSMCTGGTTLLTDATGGGTWNSPGGGIATVGATTGVVRGVSIGTTSIIYTTGTGCTATIIVTVSTPTPITGTTSICLGGTTSLSDVATGGTWASGSVGVASVNTGTGMVTSVSAGTAIITYNTSGGCAVTEIVTVNPIASITGTTTICIGRTTTLGNTVPGGTWSSGNTGVATIVASTGTLTGVSVGTSTITYVTTAGCTTTTVITVSVPTAIIGITMVCEGSTTTLSNTTTGGTWSSSNTSIATAGLITGVTAGVSAGTAIIIYNTPGGCSSATTVTVNPIAPITGVSFMCQGATVTLGNIVTGGTWSSSNTLVATVNAITGVVTGLSAGTSTIRYTTGGGCISNLIITVYTMPAAITGATLVCGAASLGDAVTGGVWSSSNITVATVNPGTGVVTAMSTGPVTITYTMPGGCYVTSALTVSPIDPIGGTPVVCQGSTTVLTYSFSGGTWSSLNTVVATVDIATGIVTGASAGTTTIRYTTLSGCIAALELTVNALYPITGVATICQGNTITLGDAATGGVWSSTNTAIASIGITTGRVTGISAGTAIISFTTSAGCTATSSLSVNPLSPIMGLTSLCAGNATTLSDATTGGTWSSSNTAVATIDESAGIVTSLAAGTSVINYTTIEGCIATLTITVHPLPTAIDGSVSLCAGNTTTLSDGLGGGVWTSGNTAVATINTSAGIVFAISAGTADITYTTTGGCFTITAITINPLPAPITGITSICVEGTTTLYDVTTGGTWSSLSSAVASIDAGTGFVSGLSAGTAIIAYTSIAGCLATVSVTVHPLPSAITGVTTICQGASSPLFDALGGGTWSSNNTSIAIIGATSGVMTGVSSGTATISYFSPFGCYAIVGVVVNPTPAISGTSTSRPTHCNTTDGTITLTGLTAWETYAVNYSFGGTPVTLSIAANAAGQVVITGLAAGSYTNITVTTLLGCVSNIVRGPIVLSLPAAPPVPVAGNNTPICAGIALDMTATDAITGVTFSWTGPGGFTSALQNPVIDPSVVGLSGTYTVTATYLGCVSDPATTLVVVHPIPDITNVRYTNPTTCKGGDGSITLAGLLAGVTYTVTYTFNTTPVSITLIADGSGDVIISGLASGSYSGINVSSFTCLSNIAGPLTLTDPGPPPPPTLGNNSPVCSGKTLLLTSSDPITGLIYDWTGPNGFSADIQDPEIPNVTMADSGVYTLTIRHLNCPASSSENVIIRPPVVLTDVTASQTIAIGSSLQLTANGAEYYLWSPNDGSLSNIDVKNPVATPQDSTTYILEGFNEWGCVDTAIVSLNVDYHIDEYIPNAFTPNNDGLNDIFRIVNAKYDKLIEFSIFNRWGEMVYDNTTDITQGWNGTYNGVPQDMGTYYYSITVSAPDGTNKSFKGSVTLVR